MSYDLKKLKYSSYYGLDADFYRKAVNYPMQSCMADYYNTVKVDYAYMEREMLRLYGSELYGEKVMDPKLFRVYRGNGTYVNSYDTEAKAITVTEELARANPGTNYYVYKAVAKTCTASPPVTVTKL